MLVGRRAGCPVPLPAVGSYSGTYGGPADESMTENVVRCRLLPVALAVALTTSGCTSFSDHPGGSEAATASSRPERETAAAVATSAPDEPLTVLADPDPVGSAAAMSRALFDSAPVVVLARTGDRAGELLAASAAVGLGVPVLLEPEGGGASDAVAT